MKYSNLTNREKIIKWFDTHPSTINSLCENNNHILDWIYDGYRGKLSAKIDLTIKLVNRSANFDLVKDENFRRIVHAFITPIETQEDYSVFVLKLILKQDKKLKMIKDDLLSLNSLILANSIGEGPNSELKNKILYSNMRVDNPSFLKDIFHKINYNSHPAIFLLQNYFLFSQNSQSQTKNTFLKIDKIHELNDGIIFSKMPFQYQENYPYIKDEMLNFSIGLNDCILDVLQTINNNQDISSKLKTDGLNPIEEIIKRDFYRNLNYELPTNRTKKNKLKI